MFDFRMAALASPKILQMNLTPAEVGQACALFVAAKCGHKIETRTRVRMDYYFNRDGKSFAGARAKVEVL